MTKMTKITVDIDGIEDMVKAMGDEFVTRVGVLGSDNQRDDGALGNADIGLVHEFGSVTGHIPARSFLRMPIEMKSKELLKAMSSRSVQRAFEQGDYEKVYSLLGVKAEEIVQNGFATGGFGKWPPLSPETIAKKGSSGILIDTAELRKSITSDVVRKSTL